MHCSKSLRIHVSPVSDSSNRYTAALHSEVLDATFSVTFHETITGAVALHSFAEMVRKHYGHAVEIVLPDTFRLSQSSTVRDVLESLNRFLDAGRVS